LALGLSDIQFQFERLEGSLEKITKLKGVSFNWIESGEPSIGLIAQDLGKIYPEVVTTNTATGYKSVDPEVDPGFTRGTDG